MLTIHICTCLQSYIGGGNTDILSLHPFLLSKTHCQSKPWCFLLLTCIVFLNVFAFVLMLLMTAGSTVLGGIWMRSLRLLHLIIITLSTTTWMQNDQLGWDRPILLVWTMWLSNVGSVPCSFILMLLIQQGHVYNSMGILCTHLVLVINYTNIALPFVATAFLAL